MSRDVVKGQLVDVVAHLLRGDRAEVRLRHLEVRVAHELLYLDRADVLHGEVRGEGVPEAVEVEPHA